MKYFEYLSEQEKNKIFLKESIEFSKDSSIDILRYAIGDLLYIPAIEKEKINNCLNNKIKGINSIVMCLEDSIGVNAEDEGISNIKETLGSLDESNLRQLIFIRPRNIQQLKKLEDILINNKSILTGIVIPKANNKRIVEFIEYLNNIKCEGFSIMPIIETLEYINIQYKNEELLKLCNTINDYKERILAIRVGVTDILGANGVRRDKELTIYDNILFSTFSSDLLASINLLGIDMIVSGSVSEFYNMDDERILKTYIKENKMDKLNGFSGKTVIHPTQTKIVQAMNVISYEDYKDAQMILENITSKHSVMANIKGDRMNEISPHTKWAKRILVLANIFGVLNEGVEFDDLYRLSLQY